MKILFEEDFEDIKTIFGVSKNFNSLKDVPSGLIPLILKQNSCYKFSLLDGKPGNFLYSSSDGGIFAISVGYRDSSETLGNKILIKGNKGLPIEFNVYLTESYIRVNFPKIDHEKNMKISSVICRNLIKRLSALGTFDKMKDYCSEMYDEIKKKPLWITDY